MAHPPLTMRGSAKFQGGWLSLWVLLMAALISLAAPASAHDIPMDLTTKVFVKPEGQTLQLLVRVPLKALQDVEFARRENDYVDLTRIDPALRDAATGWAAGNVRFYEGEDVLPAPRIASVRMSLESDPSFANYNSALANVKGNPLPPETMVFWEQGLLDVLLEYPIESDRSKFSIETGQGRLAERMVTTLEFLPPDRTPRGYVLQNDDGLVRLDPSWTQSAARFVAQGFNHILSGTDHLLFLLCLIIPFRRVQSLVLIVTAFTVAHSVTLIAAAYGLAPSTLWFQPLIETLIAMSILYMALENIITARPKARWAITFMFGLVHGFGFSFVLQHTLQFSGSHVLLSLLAFNVGIEMGQLLVLALCVPLLNFAFKYVAPERVGSIILSAFVAHTAWHWIGERFEVLSRFPDFQVVTGGVVAVAAAASLAILLRQLGSRFVTQGQGGALDKARPFTPSGEERA